MKKKLTLGLIIFISLFLCQLTVQAKENETQTVWVIAQDGLNIRKAPRITQNTPVAAVQYLTELQYVKTSCVDGWGLVLYEGKLRYISEQWISFEKKQQSIQEIILVDEEPETTSSYQFYGTCFITHYCPCPICRGVYSSGYTANGSLATPNWTVATGEDIPFGTLLSIDGQIYQVQDRGVWPGYVDIFCATHQQASALGSYYADVYIVY